MLPQTRCSGCTACAAACPRHCIEMKPDRNGFLYPHIDSAACIRCGKCARVCPVLHPPGDDGLPKAWAARNRDDSLREHSSSGGVFSALAEDVLERGGVVWGAALNESMEVVHRCARTKEELPPLRGSKYVASRLGDAFSQVQRQLQEGTQVLFTGTPCQIAGLKAFLGKEYPGLLTADLICHGVPSGNVWQEYRKSREAAQGCAVTAAGFRCKEEGWKRFSMALTFSDGSRYRALLTEDPYLRAFLSNLCLRPSCHDCAFKTTHRVADLTMADFWGVQQLMPQLDDDRGLSLVLAHTPRGEAALERLGQTLYLSPADPAAAIERNSAMTRSVEAHHFRGWFFHMLGRMSFDKLVERCFAPSYGVRLHRKLLQLFQRPHDKKKA